MEPKMPHVLDLKLAQARGRQLLAANDPPHGTPRRVILAAAALAERYGNSDVAAYNRSYHAKWGRGKAPASPRREHFWFVVGRALGAAYGRHPGQCPTNYERAIRREIDAARAAIGHEVAA